MRKLLRTFLAVATFAVAWLVVSPAHAWTNMAPICDPRGATTFAPPPQIQDAEQSLDVPEDCSSESPLESTNLVRGRGPQIDISFSPEPLAPAANGAVMLVFVERCPVLPAADLPPPSGVRQSVERPPRV